MATAMEQTDASAAQRGYARLAGLLFLGVLVLAFGGGFLASHVAGSGTFVETAQRIAASERLYRIALSIVVLSTLSSALLAFALYATLKPVDNLLAQLGMIFWVGDAFLGLIVRMCAFVRLHLFRAATTSGAVLPAIQGQADFVRNIADTTERLGGICFGIGSILFFLLFFRSKYIPRSLAALGVVASGLWIAMYFAGLIIPDQPVFRSICFPPMGLADVLTGCYLLFFAIRTDVRRDQPVFVTELRDA